MEQKTIEALTRQMNTVLTKICELSMDTIGLLSQKDSFLYENKIKRQMAATRGLLDFHDKLKFKLNQINNSYELHRTIQGIDKELKQ